MLILKSTSSLILWEGNSRIDNEPIVAILTGLTQNSINEKTGPMAQTWIIRSSVHPHEAIDNGQDVSICGECPLRKQKTGQRLCYVPQMPIGQIYTCYREGKYVRYNQEEYQQLLKFRYGIYGLRIGSYGDPCAVPLDVWVEQIELAKQGKGWTGYSRRWMEPENQPYRKYLMASVFSIAERDKAHELGWRTYRIKNIGEPKTIGEIACPASIEQGKSTICSNCRLCNGESVADSITIDVHGGQKHRWNKLTTTGII